MVPGLAPNHTRAGFAGGNRLYIEKHAQSPADFLRTSDGLWLPPMSVSEAEIDKGLVRLDLLAERQEKEGMTDRSERTRSAQIALAGASLNEIGCMTTPDLSGSMGSVAMGVFLAESGLGTFSLEDPKEAESLQICLTEGCYNPRHFDLSFGRPTLKEKTVDIVPALYETTARGSIKTIWGDTLPSVAKSLESFIKFQRRNYPFVPFEKSPLTPGSTSQVRFHPLTGCWEAWSYYCKPEDNLNWQFDGYGRLYQRRTVSRIDSETGEIFTQRRGHWLAHRVIWAASPRRQLISNQVLNHLCSHRRCCNPLHIEQVTSSRNALHGVISTEARRRLEEEDPQAAKKVLSSADLRSMRGDTVSLYVDICKKLGVIY